MKSYAIKLATFFLIAGTLQFAQAADNKLTPKEKAEGWQLLFNGKDFTGWKCSNGEPVGSKIELDSIVPYKSGGYLVVNEKQFGDFILKCDVRMGPTCNSGIFLRVADLNNPVHTGFEIQVMNGKGISSHDFGAIYDLAPITKNASKEHGKWEEVEIKCQGPHISVKVNGEKVCEINCDDFDKPGLRPDGTKHKFKIKKKPTTIKNAARQGYIGFQDHGHKVWFKNIKLLEL